MFTNFGSVEVTSRWGSISSIKKYSPHYLLTYSHNIIPVIFLVPRPNNPKEPYSLLGLSGLGYAWFLFIGLLSPGTPRDMIVDKFAMKRELCANQPVPRPRLTSATLVPPCCPEELGVPPTVSTGVRQTIP